ncbi:MAG: hypothetical protein KIG95_13545 [Comamonas sp.]|nr:hypothetical protein [Comamonas sp.]
MTNTLIHIPLSLDEHQLQRLRDLQSGFAQLCNALSPLVQQTRVWNRVALHHLAYRQLREAFPQMGSQMVCNAIYSVSRTCRRVFQNPASPFYLDKLGDKPLPILRFTQSCPVYFDRHTLSLKTGLLSMFTLDGRMRFQISLAPQLEQRFHASKLREVVLLLTKEGGYQLSFSLNDAPQTDEGADLPEYIVIDEVQEVDAPLNAAPAFPVNPVNPVTPVNPSL